MFYYEIFKESAQIKDTIKYAFFLANSWSLEVITVFLRVTIVISNHVGTIRILSRFIKVVFYNYYFKHNLLHNKTPLHIPTYPFYIFTECTAFFLNLIYNGVPQCSSSRVNGINEIEFIYIRADFNQRPFYALKFKQYNNNIICCLQSKRRLHLAIN